MQNMLKHTPFVLGANNKISCAKNQKSNVRKNESPTASNFSNFFGKKVSSAATTATACTVNNLSQSTCDSAQSTASKSQKKRLGKTKQLIG